MALRMMEYTAAIWKRLEGDDLGPGGEYPFLLPVVIYNGEHRWTAPTDVGDLLTPAPDELHGYLPRHRYLLIEIQAEDPAALPREEETRMTMLIERARQWGEERDQEWLQKGMQKAMRKGIEKGIERGRTEAAESARHRQADLRMRDRRGVPPAGAGGLRASAITPTDAPEYVKCVIHVKCVNALTSRSNTSPPARHPAHPARAAACSRLRFQGCRAPAPSSCGPVEERSRRRWSSSVVPC